MPTPTLEITPKERFWVDNYNQLLEAGYRLRPRFHPSWKPSSASKYMCLAREDHVALSYGREHINDAIRTSDNCHVMLRVYNSDSEKEVLNFLRKPEAQCRQNRTVPILDELNIDGATIFVMPFLRVFNDPLFTRRSECLEAIRQILEGLKFMHDNNIAHCDACAGNIMMDCSKLIPTSFSFVRPWTTDGEDKWIKYRTRHAVRPVDYYFIDFETARIYPDGQNSFRSVRAGGRVGQDKTLPEFTAGEIFCHAFRIDIYQIGNHVLRQRFLEPYDGLDFLLPLVEKMTQADPRHRGTAGQALEMFERLVSELDPRAARKDFISQRPAHVQYIYQKKARRHNRKLRT